MITFGYPFFLPVAIEVASGLAAAAITRIFSARATGHAGQARERPGAAGGWLAPATLTASILLYAAAFTILGALKHAAFWTFGFDLGIFTQALWLLGQGREPFITLRGLHLFGDHASFVLLLVAPLYRLANSPTVLFFLQAASIAIGAIPLYWLSRSALPGRVLPLLVPVLYLLYPPLEYVTAFEFHPEALSVSPLLFALWAGLRGRAVAYGLAAGLALICKEDVAATLVALGAFLAWSGRRRLGVATILAASAYALLYFLVVMPRYNPAGPFYGLLYAEGADAPSGTAPALVFFSRLSQGANVEAIALLLLPFGGVSLLGWPRLLIALPALLINLSSARASTHTIFYQYTATVAPWVAAAAVDGLRRLHQESAWRGAGAPSPPPASGGPSGRWGLGLGPGPIAIYVLVAGLLSHFFFAPSPLSFQFLTNTLTSHTDHQYRAPLRAFFETTERDTQARAVLSMVPSDASVAAQSLYTPHLSNRAQLYQLPVPFSNAMQPDRVLPIWGLPGQPLPAVSVDYVLLNLRREPFPMSESQALILSKRLREDPAYRLLVDQDGLLLFRRVADTSTIVRTRP